MSSQVWVSAGSPSGLAWLLYKCAALRRAAYGPSSTERPLGTNHEEKFFLVPGFYLAPIWPKLLKRRNTQFLLSFATLWKVELGWSIIIIYSTTHQVLHGWEPIKKHQEYSSFPSCLSGDHYRCQEPHCAVRNLCYCCSKLSRPARNPPIPGGKSYLPLTWVIHGVNFTGSTRKNIISFVAN